MPSTLALATGAAGAGGASGGLATVAAAAGGAVVAMPCSALAQSVNFEQAATLLAILFAGAHAIYFSAITRSPTGALVRTYWCAARAAEPSR